MSRSALLNRTLFFPIALLLLTGAAVRGAERKTAPDKPIAPGIQRERVSLVLVEVVVTTGSGRLVDDLHPDEFTLRVDGKEVKIQSVDLQVVKGVVPRTAPPEIPGEVAAPPTVAAVPVIPGHRSFVLFFDALNCELGLGPESIRSARKFLQDGLPEGEEVMIVGLGRDFVIYQDFTPNLSRALAALDEVEKDPRLRMGGQDRSRSNLGLMEEHRRWGTGHDVALGQMFGIEDERRAMRFTLALRGLIGYLQPRKGRKEIFLFSDGVASNPKAFYTVTKESGLDNELLRLSQEAASAQAALNPVNTQGLPAPRTFEAYREAKLDPALAILAVNSGGVLTHRVNQDFQKPMRAIEEQTRATYLLSYAPPGEPDGKLHSCQVRVRREGVRIRAQEGYVWMTEQQRQERETLSAYLAPEVYRAIPLALLAGSHLEGGEKPALDLAIAVPDSSLLLLPRAGHRVVRLEAGIVLRSAEGNMQDEFSRSIEARLPGEASGTPDDFTLVMRRSVPSGDYEVTAVVRDLESGEVGAIRAPVKVLSLSPDQITLSSLVLSSFAAPERRIDLDAPEGEERSPGVPSVRRIFTRTESVAGSAALYRPARDPASGEARVTVRIRINRGKDTVRPLATQRHRLKAGEGADSVPLEFPLDLSDLEPGPYELHLEAWDEVALRGVAQQVEFEVR